MIENYHVDEFGVIHQSHSKPMVYDQAYLSYYDDLSDRTIKLGYQRMGWLLGQLDRIPESVLEVGYGTGTFIEAAQITGVPVCVGCDIADYPLPEGVTFMNWDEALQRRWDVAAMYDVLEHIPDLDFLSHLQTDYLVLAVPFCRWRELGDDWFRNWRMLLPDEHLHHFDDSSLRNLMNHYGFDCVTTNTFEDGIRLRSGEQGPNILSGLFKSRASRPSLPA
ncbi:MAG: class I SAM-dependent methyltransferase [Pirellulaceae bacterium]|nr:class I SAM-dependent methyltransferase [Pirellulaceae bacterium]